MVDKVVRSNQHQIEAIFHQNGSLLIVAGAGTGKTYILTERVKNLVLNLKIDPYNIFLSTFTQRASEELRLRLDTVMPFGYREPWLGTFHQLCERILRLEGLEIGINPDFSILTEIDQWLFIKSHLYDFDLDYYRPLGNPAKFISSLITFFGRLGDEDIAEADFVKLINRKKNEADSVVQEMEIRRQEELIKAYNTYQNLKRRDKKMDFNDLILLTLRLFRERPNVLFRYQKQFTQIMVDEFQDTNIAQFELVQLLAPPSNNSNLVVVGDDNQSIYKFRSASVSNILQFREKYVDSKLVVLNDNYRSTQPILDSAYRLIVNNNPDTLETKLSISKKLLAHHDKTDRVKVLSFETAIAEAVYTATEIDQIVSKKGIEYKDIAILARANSHLDLYLQALKDIKIPFQLAVNHGLFDQKEILGIIRFFEVLVDPDDSVVLFDLLRLPIWHKNEQEILKKIAVCRQKGMSLWQMMKVSRDETDQEIVETILKFRNQTLNLSVSELMMQFIESTGMIKDWLKLESVENELKIRNVNLFYQKIKRFELNTKVSNLMAFLNTLADWRDAGENPGQAYIEDIDAVTLSTIHAAKGLEYEVVFVGNLLGGRFPANNRKDTILVPEELIKEKLSSGDEHIQEERRLLYVAMTRAKRLLYITYATDLGGIKKWKPSGFIAETGLKATAVGSMINIPKTLLTETSLEKTKYNINTVSYSQIDTFESCPLKYKYRYLFKIPARPHHSISFGRTVHEVLYEFHHRELIGKVMNLNELEESYRHHFSGDGFENAISKEKMFQAGLNGLVNYYRTYSKLMGKPYLLEQSFRLPLDGVTIVGKIDRIDRLSRENYAIVDYKTGEAKTQEKVNKDEQLTIYALACREIFHLPVVKLALYFVRFNQLVVTSRSEEQLISTREKIRNTINKMRTSNFRAKPDSIRCGYCEYRELCPFAKR